MSKHRKFKDKKRFLSPKRIRRYLFRLFLLAVGGAIGILARPSLVQDPIKRAQVEGIRDQLLQANDVGQEKALQVLGETSGVAQDTLGKVSEITREVTNTDPQVLIQEKVTLLKEEVKSLPEKEIKRIKLEFCQDVIEDIELTCEAK